MSEMRSSDRIRAEVEKLKGLSFSELKERYRQLAGGAPPKRIGRKLLTLAVAYEIQAAGHRRLITKVCRRLEALNRESGRRCGNNEHARNLKPGGRLIREWRGKSYEVYMADDGVYWNGTRYRSLSAVARAITGAAWNGPAFFGLRSPRTKP